MSAFFAQLLPDRKVPPSVCAARRLFYAPFRRKQRMDAHVFRALCHALTPRLVGAWLDKIQEPAPGVTSLALALPHHPAPGAAAPGSSRKAWLVLRAERKDPFLFLTRDKPSAPVSPSAPVMRLRKYAAGRRILSLVPDFAERRLWLLLHGDAPAGLAPRSEDTRPAALWLLLDLREGPALRLLTEAQSPHPVEPAWPAPDQLEDACRQWRDWPVITPALRRVLPLMDTPDQAALLEDLRMGGGDLFLYQPVDAAGAACDDLEPRCLLSAWPLPPERRPALWPNWRETAGDDILSLTEQAGKLLVLARAGRDAAGLAAAPLLRQERKTARLLEKMREEESRLQRMCAQLRDAEALRANLWRWPADARLPFVDVEEYADDGSVTTRRLAIDPRRTVREEMEALFHAARRGRRGLDHVARRRKELEAELARLQQDRRGILAGSLPDPRLAAPAPTEQAARLPRNVQLFISSDGFALLRGRDAKGNGAARRMAAPHDIWLHADGGPGSHVIIRRAYAGQEVPERTLDEAGGLAACKSWLRDAARARILYAEVRHIKPLRGAAPGTVRMDKIWLSREVPVRPELETLLAPAAPTVPEAE